MLALSAPATGQDTGPVHVDDEILRLTPITRQLDFVQFLPNTGAMRPAAGAIEMFGFDNVLLPATSWTDDDPDTSVRRHMASARDIRASIVPQINPRGTVSLILTGTGETPLDSDAGQAGFRASAPSVPDATMPDSGSPMSGS